MLKVSDRTIRSDIDVINSYYRCRLITADRRKGYSLDRACMEKLNLNEREPIPQTSQQRCDYLVKELLFKNREINLVEMQNKMFVSSYSLDNDIRKIKEKIQKYPNLKLIRSNNHLKLYGSEEEKRKFYRELLLREVKDNPANLNAISDIWKEFDILLLTEDFNTVCRKYHYEISEREYPVIMLYIGLSIERMMKRHYIDKKTVRTECMGREYLMAKELYQRISEIYQIQAGEGEISWFAAILKEWNEKEGSQSEIQPRLDTLMEEIFRVLITEFDIDLTKDEEFKEGILAHIRRMGNRQQISENDDYYSEWYIYEVKRKYPIVFETAVRVAECIEQICKIRLNETEISFLSLYLGAALQRININTKYKVSAIIPDSRIIAQSCVEKLLFRFGNRIEIANIHSFFEERKILEDGADIILTTVPLKHHLNLPTIKTSLFINEEDESKFFQLLNMLDKRKYHSDFMDFMRRLMRRDLFYFQSSMKSREEILEFLCDSLYEKGLCNEAFKEHVFKREALSSTSFAQGVAVPHALDARAERSCISVMTLKEPVWWGTFQVRLVVLLAIRETDNNLLKVFFEWLCNVASDSGKFEKLIGSSGYEEFMEYINTLDGREIWD